MHLLFNKSFLLPPAVKDIDLCIKESYIRPKICGIVIRRHQSRYILYMLSTYGMSLHIDNKSISPELSSDNLFYLKGSQYIFQL